MASANSLLLDSLKPLAPIDIALAGPMDKEMTRRNQRHLPL
jgi:hypothetical protein